MYERIKLAGKEPSEEKGHPRWERGIRGLGNKEAYLSQKEQTWGRRNGVMPCGLLNLVWTRRRDWPCCVQRASVNFAVEASRAIRGYCLQYASHEHDVSHSCRTIGVTRWVVQQEKRAVIMDEVIVKTCTGSEPERKEKKNYVGRGNSPYMN
eukprot:1142524-Pelagomonas_calceolata.AAC.2